MKIGTVAFDFDGVLADSNDTKGLIFFSLFSPFGLEYAHYALNYHRENPGKTRTKKLQHLASLIKFETGWEIDQESIERQFAEQTIAKISTDETLIANAKYLSRQRQVSKVIVSAAPEADLRKILKNLGADNLFSEVLGGETPKTTSLDWLRRTYGEPLYFVGDAESDKQAAKLSGVTFIGFGPLFGRHRGLTASTMMDVMRIVKERGGSLG